MTKLSALFALDALGGGFLTTSLLSYFFATRFGASAATIGALFFLARVANALSHFVAAWLARRIGLVNTMVFTHIPSSLLLVTVAIAPSFPIAAALFVLREGLVEMDVPTRQSYVMAVVQPEERTVASGVTSLVRLGAWAVAPSFAGLFMEGGSLRGTARRRRRDEDHLRPAALARVPGRAAAGGASGLIRRSCARRARGSPPARCPSRSGCRCR